MRSTSKYFITFDIIALQNSDCCENGMAERDPSLTFIGDIFQSLHKPGKRMI